MQWPQAFPVLPYLHHTHPRAGLERLLEFRAAGSEHVRNAVSGAQGGQISADGERGTGWECGEHLRGHCDAGWPRLVPQHLGVSRRSRRDRRCARSSSTPGRSGCPRHRPRGGCWAPGAGAGSSRRSRRAGRRTAAGSARIRGRRSGVAACRSPVSSVRRRPNRPGRGGHGATPGSGPRGRGHQLRQMRDPDRRARRESGRDPHHGPGLSRSASRDRGRALVGETGGRAGAVAAATCHPGAVTRADFDWPVFFHCPSPTELAVGGYPSDLWGVPGPDGIEVGFAARGVDEADFRTDSSRLRAASLRVRMLGPAPTR